ncbi:Mad3/Bub1 homology region 1, partial [Dillenia turbinata]
MDPETELLYSKKETGNEWEMLKENARPLKRGRNIALLNEALKSHTHNLLKESLFEHCRSSQTNIPFLPLVPNFLILYANPTFSEGHPPPRGAVETTLVFLCCTNNVCDLYKDDHDPCYLKVRLKYVQFVCLISSVLCSKILWIATDFVYLLLQADNCNDAEAIFSFLDAKHIGESHSLCYIGYAKHMESRNKVKIANDIFSLGIASSISSMFHFVFSKTPCFALTLNSNRVQCKMEKDIVMVNALANHENLTENRLLTSFETILARREANALKKKCKPN